MKNVFSFYLKTEGTFWPTQYMKIVRLIILSLTRETCTSEISVVAGDVLT